MRLAHGAARIALAIAVLLVLAVVFLAPYLWIAASSLKRQSAIFADLDPIAWRTFWPGHPTLKNFVDLFVQRHLGRAIVNSLIVSACQVAGTLVLCSTAAYGLTRIRFAGSNVVFLLILVTFLLPVESLVIPLYATVAGMGLDDSLVAAFAPWLASSFGLFMLRQAFEELPRELDDAARIDGAGHARVFWSIILPNVRTPLATLGLVTFLFSWNAFLWPLVILQSPDNQLIQIAVAQSTAPGQLANWGETFAGAVIATLPLVFAFVFLQRYFVRGISQTGMK